MPYTLSLILTALNNKEKIIMYHSLEAVSKNNLEMNLQCGVGTTHTDYKVIKQPAQEVLQLR